MAQRLSPHLVHTDAAFTPDEEAYLMFGAKVECRSSWIKYAQWTEATSTLELWMESGNSYPLSGIDWPQVQVFMEGFSKGVWWHVEWLETYGKNKPFSLSEEDRIPNRARRVLS
jgi:hypothetical protein